MPVNTQSEMKIQMKSLKKRRGNNMEDMTTTTSSRSSSEYSMEEVKISPRDALKNHHSRKNSGMASMPEIIQNISVEFKLLFHHIFDILMIVPAAWAAFYFTNMATYRHETVHQFANRAGLYNGPNDTNSHPVGTNFDHLRARDLGFELIPENHSEAFASIIDIVPPFIGILVFTPMFIAAVTRKFNKTKHDEADRFFVSMIAEGVLLIAIMVAFRCVFFLSTALPAPDRECVRGIRDWSDNNQASKKAEGLHHNPSCGDLIYSGHFNMSFSFFMYYITESHRFFRGESPLVKAGRYLWGMFVFSIIVVQVYGILSTRHHYTIDIVVVPFVDYFVRNAVVPKLGMSYDRLVNRHAILHSSFKGFRLFGQSYVNADVDAGHGGPGRKLKIVVSIFGVIVPLAVVVAWYIISQTLLNKLARNCPATPDDAWCHAANYLQPMFL